MRIMALLGDPTEMEVTKVTFYPDDIREITDIISGATTYERKTTIKDTAGAYYRYVESREIPTTRAHITGNPTGTYVYRLRYIYRDWTASGYDLHITFRTTIAERVSQSTSIELETSRELPSNTISSLAERIMSIHNGWNISNMARLVSSMENNMHATALRYPQQLQRPFDLTWRGFTYDNLIEKRTAISFKADGTRMLLCMSQPGTFMITSNLDIVPLNTRPYNGILLVDGELMGDTYYAFDLLHHNGQDYRDKGYDVRHKTLSRVLDTGALVTQISPGPIIPTSGQTMRPGAVTIIVKIKPIIIPTTVDEFYNAVEEMRNVPIKTDGLILTPIQQNYSQSVYKWKPEDLMTVDFFVGRNYVLHTFEDGQLKPHPELQASREGVDLGIVAEFKYVGDNQWMFERQRLDKATPNSERVYQAITSLIRDPISIAAMTGRSLRPMRKYHNRVKGMIYDYLRAQGVRTLTDIGSGRGGDLTKWKENEFSVIAVEPDVYNVTGEGGFLDRARSMDTTIYEEKETVISGLRTKTIDTYYIQGDKWDVTLYPMPAQEYPIEQETDALTMFNVATFLGPEVVTTLSDEAVRQDGYLVMMVIDGKCIESKFLQGSDVYDGDLIKIERVASRYTNPATGEIEGCGTVTETFGNLGCIQIQLIESSTVVRPQVEGLVDVESMISMLAKEGWVPTTDMYLTAERLMGEEEMMYSSCQRLLIFKRVRVGNTIIRRTYRPLAPNKEENIPNSPWGPLVRVGTQQSPIDGSSTSFIHAILRATDARYRSMDEISKSVYATQYRGKIARGEAQLPGKIYMIPQTSWDIYSQEMMYPALGGVGMTRDPGVVLMYNEHHWEPLARKNMEGNLQYIW